MVRMTNAFGFIDVLHELLLLPVRKTLTDTEKDEETGSCFKSLLLWSLSWLTIGDAWSRVFLVVFRLKT